MTTYQCTYCPLTFTHELEYRARQAIKIHCANKHNVKLTNADLQAVSTEVALPTPTKKAAKPPISREGQQSDQIGRPGELCFCPRCGYSLTAIIVAAIATEMMKQHSQQEGHGDGQG
jgi:hypothetical protein